MANDNKLTFIDIVLHVLTLRWGPLLWGTLRPNYAKMFRPMIKFVSHKKMEGTSRKWTFIFHLRQLVTITFLHPGSGKVLSGIVPTKEKTASQSFRQTWLPLIVKYTSSNTPPASTPPPFQWVSKLPGEVKTAKEKEIARLYPHTLF